MNIKKSLILAAASVFLVVGCGENQGGGVGDQPAGIETDQGTAPGNMPEPGTPTPEIMMDTNQPGATSPDTTQPGTTAPETQPGTTGSQPPGGAAETNAPGTGQQ